MGDKVNGKLDNARHHPVMNNIMLDLFHHAQMWDWVGAWEGFSVSIITCSFHIVLLLQLVKEKRREDKILFAFVDRQRLSDKFHYNNANTQISGLSAGEK